VFAILVTKDNMSTSNEININSIYENSNKVNMCKKKINILSHIANHLWFVNNEDYFIFI
jgi:hypothetical protein